ncbi:MAG: hypothetical protein HFH23_17200 [Ruminococcus sp.]|nr:hypothetical protein [Ruminococcus sp.]
MEERGTIFDYLAQVMVVFGFAMLMLNIFCLLFGESAKEISTMYELGSAGVPVEVCFQFLAVSFFIVAARFVFFTDWLIKNMAIWLRTVCMLGAVIILVAVFATGCGWIPKNTWQAWAMFLASFALSFVGSCFVMTVKEKMENKRMEEALRRLKEDGKRGQERESREQNDESACEDGEAK